MPEYKQSIKRIPGSLKIVEMMETVQGEGLHIGCPSVFVRTGMCNLACPGCDTCWDDWTLTKVENVAEKIKTFKAKHVVLTGGEPTLWQSDLAQLCNLLDGYTITIETNGAVPIENLRLLERVDLWSFSPKVGSLGHEEKFSWMKVFYNLHRTNGKNQIKYVLDPHIPAHVDKVFKFQFIVDGFGTEFGPFDTDARVPDDRVFFQPYDRDCTVNTADRTVPGAPISIRNAPLNESSYAKDLAALTKLVMERSGSRFRVLPQMHKILIWR